jgi:hypothetical protein
MDIFGLSWEQVSTQEGKASHTTICDHPFQVRDLLGSLGNMLEDKFGSQILPEAALKYALAEHPGKKYVYASVRKNQARTFKEAGGICIEVKRPGCEWSGYDFDLYDQSLVDFTINNDGTIKDLRAEVLGVLGQLEFNL